MLPAASACFVGYRTEEMRECAQNSLMNRYEVVASNEISAIVAFQDARGHCHIGRALAVVPKEGAFLRGPAPSLGLHPMRLAPEGEPCPVAIALLDCDPGLAKLVVAVEAPERVD